MPDLVLGPILRYVGNDSATVWVQTGGPCTVEIAGSTARTFQVGDCHYALVVVTGLRPGTSITYQVRLDGLRVWPPAGLPASRIKVGDRRRHTMVFGSCRMPEADDPALGRDAVAAYAQRMSTQDPSEWPDSLVLLGDQIYADGLTESTKDWIARRRPAGDAGGVSGVADFAEYVQLYKESWSTRWNRWLMSTVSTSMMLDDHEVIDDWNTSQAWRDRMARTPWWAEREISALVSYWVYQHIGNLSPEALAKDETYAQVVAAQGDTMAILREFARAATEERDGRKPARWSYRRDFGPVRLLMIDTRAGRILRGERRLVSDEEFAWLEDNAEGDYDHLLIGSSLPWLMPHVISDLQSLNEIGNRRTGWRGRLAERLRQAGDHEHWPAFRDSFERLTRLIRRAAEGDAALVCVLSGDVHHIYTAQARFDKPVNAKVFQVVCSPLHNHVPRFLHPFFHLGWFRPIAAVTRLWLRRHVKSQPVAWRKVDGPYVTNAIATLRISGREADVVVERADDLEPISRLKLT